MQDAGSQKSPPPLPQRSTQYIVSIIICMTTERDFEKTCAAGQDQEVFLKGVFAQIWVQGPEVSIYEVVNLHLFGSYH